MRRLTCEDGFEWYRTRNQNREIYERLKYYEDLEERGKLKVVHATHAATTEEEAWKRLGMVDEGYLLDWYISSVSDEDEPVWTEEHIKELYNDFIVIPRKVRLNEL